MGEKFKIEFFTKQKELSKTKKIQLVGYCHSIQLDRIFFKAGTQWENQSQGAGGVIRLGSI